MAVSIGALRYDLIADTSRFVQQLRNARTEMSDVRAMVKAQETPFEAYMNKFRQLRKLVDSGRISQEKFIAVLKQLNREYAQVKNTDTRLEKFFGKANAIFPQLGSILTVTGALAMARRAFTEIRQEMQAIDDLAKKARLYGMTVGELQSARLAGSEMAGMNAAQIDMSMQRFARRLGEAKRNTGEALPALRALNIQINQLKDKTAYQQLLLVADAMSKVKNEQERLRIAFKLFDSEGAKFALAMANGSSQLLEYRQKVRDLGLEMSAFETGHVEAANDQWERMNLAIKGVGQSIAIIAAGPLKAFAEEMELIGRYNKGFEQSGLRKGTANFTELLYRQLMGPVSVMRGIKKHVDEMAYGSTANAGAGGSEADAAQAAAYRGPGTYGAGSVAEYQFIADKQNKALLAKDESARMSANVQTAEEQRDSMIELLTQLVMNLSPGAMSGNTTVGGI